MPKAPLDPDAEQKAFQRQIQLPRADPMPNNGQMRLLSSASRLVLLTCLGVALSLPCALPAQAAGMTIPGKEDTIPFLYVDVQKLMKDYPKAASFETTLKSLAELARAELGAVEEKWRAANAAGKTEEAARLQKEYSALKQTHEQDFSKKKQQMGGVIWEDIRKTVEKAFTTNLFGYVVVYDQKQGKNQSGHFISASSGEDSEDLANTRTDLTFALTSLLNNEPDAASLVSITTTPRYGPCYKVNFNTLLNAHPRQETVKTTLKTVQEAEAYSLTQHPELLAIQQMIKRLSEQAGDPAELEAALEKRRTELREKQTALQAESRTRINELHARLISHLMHDIQQAIADLMQPVETYTIVSDHITSYAIPAYQIPEDLKLADITSQIAARLKTKTGP